MSTLKCTTLSNSDASLSVPVDTVVQGSAKAWVNFNGTGTVAIMAAFNVSSITDNGTGDYTANFITAMPDVNYALAGFARNTVGAAAVSVAQTTYGYNQTTTAVDIITGYYNGSVATNLDCPSISLTVFR